MSYISTIPSAFEIRVRALKPWTLPSSVLPILLGTLLAYKSTKPFDPYPFVLCSFVIIGLHTAGNFVNSYYEAKSRAFFTRPLERNAIIYETARCAVATYCIVIPSFGLLLFSSIAYIWQELTLFCVGFIASILFGRCLRNIAVGELAVSAVYGPLCVIFTYAVQVGSRREFNGSWLCLYSLPLALCTECFLHSQNIRDLKTDGKNGSTTLAVLLGYNYAINVLSLLLLAPHLVTTFLGFYVSKYFFFPLLCLPLAMLSLPKYNEDIVVLPEKTSVVGVMFGLLYLLSLLYSF